MMAGRLDGLVALVTGGGRGIGRGVAETFAAEGASVVVNDLGTSAFGDGADASPAQQVADEITAGGGSAIADTGDITDPAAAAAMVEKAIDTFGKLDILANIAGTIRLCTIADCSDEDWNSQMRVHLRGYFNTTQNAARHWMDRGVYGRLINFTSGAGHWQSQPSVLSYSTAKSGVIGFTRACANSLAVYNVTANCVSPRTGGGTPMADAVMKDSDSSTAAGTERDPLHIAPMVTFLASPAAGNVSGRVFGAYAGRYTLWSEPTEEREAVRDFLTDPDGVYAEIERSLCSGLSLADLPSPTTKLPDDWRDQFGIRVPWLDLAVSVGNGSH
jgi:3-oxoacyl-[acyl-carrier protein] reductase